MAYGTEPAKTPEQEANASVSNASRATKDALAAIATTSAKVVKQREELVDMQYKLDKLLTQVSIHLAEMETREKAILEATA